MKTFTADKLQAALKDFLTKEAGITELERDLAATKNEVESFLESVDPLDKAALTRATETVSVKQTYIGLLPRKIERLKTELAPSLRRVGEECERSYREFEQVVIANGTEEIERLAKNVPESLVAGAADPNAKRRALARQAGLWDESCGFSMRPERPNAEMMFLNYHGEPEQFGRKSAEVVTVAKELLALFDAYKKNGSTFVAKSMQKFLK
ncbi:MAG: hypothetical protein PCFJNLEI_00320 [Verrucomicrobiae bacterium]|nr:hypothetical protein [Verrucomicrobiae bacterium]